MTLIIELTIAYILGIRKDDLKKIAFINIMTNVPLNILVNILLRRIISNYYLLFIIIILEIIVVIIEGNYFKKLNNSIIGVYKLSILLNVFSYSYGLVYKLLMSIF